MTEILHGDGGEGIQWELIVIKASNALFLPSGLIYGADGLTTQKTVT
jgi:hypothetical protein